VERRAATAARLAFPGRGPAGLNPAARVPITWAMPIEATLERIAAIRQAIADPARLVGGGGAGTGGTEAPPGAAGTFAGALAQAQASGAYTTTGAAAASMLGEASAPGLTASGVPASPYPPQGLAGAGFPSTGSGSRLLAIAESQLGQSEQPPGSNESPAIAEYRSAVAGAAPGEPWCAYFVSWAARQAGAPIGPGGEGLGSVSAIWSWAQSSGRAIVNGPGVVPKPGDLIVFGGEHVGIVRGVLPDGRIQTIEGNYSNKVSANVRSAGEATGYVSMS